MKCEITEDFVGIFDDVLPEDSCEEFINTFVMAEKSGMVDPRRAHRKHQVQDTALSYPFEKRINLSWQSKVFFDSFWENCYPLYSEKYSILDNFMSHNIFDIILQKTEVGQGYHVWHTEKMGLTDRNRIAAFLLYLNDVEEGGETEFLYLKKRFKPIRNRMLMFPSSFTHTHRGNPPLSNTKYVLTGWLEFGPPTSQ